MKTLDVSLHKLDPASRLRVRIFTFKLVVVLVTASALAAPGSYQVLPIVSVFCLWQAMFAALAAVFWRHQFDAPCLTAWDEAAAFAALALLARFIAAGTY
jgi:hypothetical protein